MTRSASARCDAASRRARRGIAVPAIHVERQAGARRDLRRLDAAPDGIGLVGTEPAPRFGRGEQAAHHDLLRANLPARAALHRLRQSVEQPSFLIGAHQLARRVAVIAFGELLQRRRGIGLAFQYLAQLKGAVAGGDARFGQEDRREIAGLIMAPPRFGDGHPFAIGAFGGGFADAPVTLAFTVIFGAALPHIVRELMIVPLRDHREQRMEALEIGVGAIGGVAEPIVGEADHLVRRLDVAAGQRILQRGIFADPIFVEIVADVRHEVDVAARRGVGIGVEPAEGQVRAGEERDGEGARRSGGKRARAAGDRLSPVGRDEAVEIPAAGFEPVDGDFRGVIALALRGDAAARRDAREVGAFG